MIYQCCQVICYSNWCLIFHSKLLSTLNRNSHTQRLIAKKTQQTLVFAFDKIHIKQNEHVTRDKLNNQRSFVIFLFSWAIKVPKFSYMHTKIIVQRITLSGYIHVRLAVCSKSNKTKMNNE